MRSIKCPVLVAHSRVDGMIPFSHGEKLFAAAEPKKFVELYGTHNSSGLECEEGYRRAYLEFVLKAGGISGKPGG